MSWSPPLPCPAARSPAAGCFPRRRSTAGSSAGLLTTAPLAQPAPPIVGGSHDPLLEWALRESGSGLATLPEGSESGLRRLARGDVMAAAIHLHRIEGDDDSANADAVANAPGLHDVVLIAFARREQGLLVAPGNPLKLSDIASAAAARARMALRPNGAGAQLLLLALLARAGIAFEALNALKPPCPTGPDIAQAVRIGRADCGIATRAVALTAGLDFIPLTWEHFDLALRQRDLFPARAAGAGRFPAHGGVPRARRRTQGLRRRRNRQASATSIEAVSFGLEKDRAAAMTGPPDRWPSG